MLNAYSLNVLIRKGWKRKKKEGMKEGENDGWRKGGARKGGQRKKEKKEGGRGEQ